MLTFPRRPLAILTAMLVAGLGACSAGSEPGGPGRAALASGPAGAAPLAPKDGAEGARSGDWGGEWCESSAVTCSEYAGLPTALVHRSSSAAAGVVLVDFGGPGVAMMQSLDLAGDLPLPPRLDVLLVGEPWEVTVPTPSCLVAEAARIARRSSLDTVSCDLSPWTFVPTAYRAAVDAALSATGQRLVAAVGVSFGAVRVAAATDRDVPLALLSPAPPKGTLAEVLAPRASALESAATASCAGARDCIAAVRRLGRNGAVTNDADLETALALIGAARDSTLLTTTARSLPRRSDPAVAESITRQAYGATFRYGEGSVLPNLFGYRAGTCGQYPPKPVVTAGGYADVLARVLSCPPRALGTPAPVDPVGRRGCVLVARNDVVTPPQFAAGWVAPGMTLVRDAMSGHGAIDDRASRLLSALPGSLTRC